MYLYKITGEKGGDKGKKSMKWFTIIMKMVGFVECYIIYCVMSTNVTNSTSYSVLFCSKTAYLE